MNPEQALQNALTLYLNLQYSKIPFYNSEKGAYKATGAQQNALQRLRAANGYKQPDMSIFAPSKDGKHAALFLELKAKTPYLKDGTTLRKDDHLQAQAESLAALQEKGYKAVFVWDFEQGKRVIDEYFSNY